MARIIGITGGIGSGKSVVCGVLKAMGYSVYDCDSEAKKIMDSSNAIKERIRRELCENAICADDSIDRQLLASVIFADDNKRDLLNSIVHEAVRKDIISHANEPSLSSPLFVESAILYTSGLNTMMYQIWEVIAPEEVRIKRVMLRSALSVEHIKMRMASQSYEFSKPGHKYINNDGVAAVIPQIERLIASI